MQLIWEEFLRIIKEEAGSQVVETWFKAVCFKDWNPATGQVILRVPNQFVSKWLQEHYVELIKLHLSRLVNASNLKILFICGDGTASDNRDIVPASVLHTDLNSHGQQMDFGGVKKHSNQIVPVDTKTKMVPIEPRNKEKNGNIINEQYQFGNFVVGPNNSLAHAAAHAICENLGNVYNPLFIYGCTGLGKTHLLHAIGNAVLKKDPSLVVRYITADSFINEFINSIRLDRVVQLRNKYQKLDLLLIDDIQFLSNKEQTQEAFFHIFNTLYEQQKQIVLSSDTFPKEINGLQNRLKSRLEWGLVADIQIPDLETKMAILNKKAEHSKIILPSDVADFIASRVLSNIRELEGALIRVEAFSSLTNQPISLAMAQKVLMNLNERKKEGVLLDSVLKSVAKHFAVSITEIKSKKRQKDIAMVRQVVLYLMKKHTFCSLQVIGNFVGGRDHSTVIHAINKIESMTAQNSVFAQKLRMIEQEILSS